MKILIEGVDGIGKSTLCQKLSDKFGMSIIHNRADTDNSRSYYTAIAAVPNLIQDRSYISEEIYSIVFGRPIRLSPNGLAGVKQAADNIVKIILYSSSKDGVSTWYLNNSDETKELQDQQFFINKLYKGYAKSSTDPYLIAVDIEMYKGAEIVFNAVVNRIAQLPDFVTEGATT